MKLRLFYIISLYAFNNTVRLQKKAAVTIMALSLEISRNVSHYFQRDDWSPIGTSIEGSHVMQVRCPLLRLFWLLCIGVGMLALLAPSPAQAAADSIVVLRVEGTINPVVAGYVERGISLAEEWGATTCIIQMDTPGGLDSSMRDIVQAIMEADVPVVVYIPPGSRAASAGAFITLSAHVAAMAPGTSAD
jgi:hypothetical protein